MFKKLGRYITILNGAAFLAVILVGGVSIYLTKDILHNAYKIERLSKDILTVDSIHTDTYRLILAMHNFLIDHDEIYSDEAVSLIPIISKKVEDYRKEEMEKLGLAENPEIELLNTMLGNIKQLSRVNDFFENYWNSGVFDQNVLLGLESFAFEVRETTESLNQIHVDRISTLTSESLRNMWVILILYAGFFFVGAISVLTGHRLIKKKVIEPINELASATSEFVEGKFTKRVHTDSKTEIGLLYQAFNKMAGELQEHDALMRKFNEELEKKVAERTTELQRSNEELKKTQAVLIRAEKIAAIGQIAAGVAHEIKTPLSILSLNIQMMMKDLAETAGPEVTGSESATQINYEVNRISKILDEFVKFARFPEPRFILNDVNTVIREVAELYSQKAEDAGVRIVLSLRDDIPVFKFDARQFKAVLINLTQNALSAIQNGGTLELNSTIKKGKVQVNVSDTGTGIEEIHLNQIFDPFFSTKEEGLGLGLAIAQRIVESHGGKISCRSRPGEGTMFSVQFPEHLKPSILIVDDERMIRESLARHFSHRYFVRVAYDGEQALEILKRHPAIELVLCDLKMPRKDGMELLENIRTISSETIFILMTALLTPEAEQKMKRMGAHSYHAKPLNLAELEKTVNGAISNKFILMKSA